MKKLPLILGFLTLTLFTNPLRANWPVSSIDGYWEGKIEIPDIHTSYDLKLWAKTENRKLTIWAQTEYGILTVDEAKLTFSDVHSPSGFDATMREVISYPNSGTYHEFKFVFTGWVYEKHLIEGYVDHSFDGHPSILRGEGDFVLRKVSSETKPPWLNPDQK